MPINSPVAEPEVFCPRCRSRYSMLAASQNGMRCYSCRGPLQMLDVKAAGSTANTAASVAGPEIKLREPIEVAELHLPSSNSVDIDGIRSFLSSLPLPLNLEYYGQAGRRSMLVRGPQSALRHVAAQLNAVWPACRLETLKTDPCAEMKSGVTFSVWLKLKAKPYLPLRTWESFRAGNDPVNTLFSTFSDLVDGERASLQFHLRAATTKPDWLPKAQELWNLQKSGGRKILSESLSQGDGNVYQAPIIQRLPANRLLGLLFGFALFLVSFIFAVLQFWPLFVIGILAAAAISIWSLSTAASTPDPWQGADLELVEQKIFKQSSYFKVAVRLTVSASDSYRAEQLLSRILSSTNPYELVGGNGFLQGGDAQGTSLWPSELVTFSEEPWIWLSADEFAGIWHPPYVEDGIAPSLARVNTVENRSPDPRDVGGHYQIGESDMPDGRRMPVCINPRLQQQNSVLIGKSGAGKSNLLSHWLLAALESPEKVASVVIDPHGELIRELLGIIPERHLHRVRILDSMDSEFSFPYNPLNVHRAGWDIGSVTRSVVDVGKSLWAEYWGPRMQLPLSRGVEALAAANQGRDPEDQIGLSILPYLMNMPADYRTPFLNNELASVPDVRERLLRYFTQSYDRLTPHMREEIISPIVSKAFRFEEDPLLHLFSCPLSKLDFQEILQKRLILLVSTHMSEGQELSSFIGSLFLNVLMREMSKQIDLPPEQRIPVQVIIDEFQSFTGVNWETMLMQMRKFGGRFALGTQSLASLRQQQLDPGIILGGTYSIFTFTVDGEDAEYLATNELRTRTGGVNASTLINLPPFDCCVKTVDPDGRPIDPYLLHVRPPAPFSEAAAQQALRERASYSLPVATARRMANEMLARFVSPQVRLTSTGAGAPAEDGGQGAAASVLRSIQRGTPEGRARVGTDELSQEIDAFARDFGADLAAGASALPTDDDDKPGSPA